MTLALRIKNNKYDSVKSILDSVYYQVATLGIDLNLTIHPCKKFTYWYLYTSTRSGEFEYVDQSLTTFMVQLAKQLGRKNVYLDITNNKYKKARDF